MQTSKRCGRNVKITSFWNQSKPEAECKSWEV